MKPKVILLVSLLCIVAAGSLLAQKSVWSAGLEGGPGLSLIYGNGSVYSQSEFALAGAAGIFGEYGFAGAFSAKLALHYERISTITDNRSSSLPAGGKLQYNLDYLTLPALVKWSFGSRPGFFINAGPSISLLLGESLLYLSDSGSISQVADQSAAYYPVSIAVTVGAGMFVPIGDHLLLTIELRDNFGVMNIRSGTSGFERSSYIPEPLPVGYTNSTLLLAGISYRFGSTKGLPCTPNDPGFQYIRK